MPKYNQTDVTGESWVRANRITCINEYGNNPSIYYQEEEIVNLSNDKIFKSPQSSMSTIGTDFGSFNANTEFNIINPETDLPTGQTAKYQDLYVLLHSLYFHLAEKRDLSKRFIDPVP